MKLFDYAFSFLAGVIVTVFVGASFFVLPVQWDNDRLSEELKKTQQDLANVKTTESYGYFRVHLGGTDDIVLREWKTSVPGLDDRVEHTLACGELNRDGRLVTFEPKGLSDTSIGPITTIMLARSSQ